MSQLDLRDFYSNTITHYKLGPAATKLFARIVANDDQGEAYEEALRCDRFFTTKVISAASEVLKKGSVKSLTHAVVLFGKETVRNFVLGHTVLRQIDTSADQKFEDMGKSKNFLKRGLEAEELALKSKNEYPGFALAVGFIYDIIENKMNADPRMTQHLPFFESCWKHALRTASLASAMCSHERMLINLKRLSFAAGLTHDLGRLLLLVSYPERYQNLMKKFDEAKLATPSDDSPQMVIEKEEFGLSHAELGAFFCYSFGYLQELEEIVDFHHDFAVLKTRDKDHFLLAMILNIADRLAYLIETDPKLEIAEINKILEPHRQAFPLRADEVQTLAFLLRSKVLLP
ncbi:MAG: HDOD domain-containing protein [Bdellovibrionales bacterium]